MTIFLSRFVAFPSFVCVERADGASQECDGENLGVFTTTTDCCNTAGAGGFLIAGFNFCDECSPRTNSYYKM